MKKIKKDDMPAVRLTVTQLREEIKKLKKDEALCLERDEFPGHSDDVAKRAANVQMVLRRDFRGITVRYHQPGECFYVF